MTKAIVIPDLAYTSPAGRRGMGSNGKKELVAKLKYFQYRDDANGHIPQEQGLERWVDCGLGSNYRQIMQSCERLGSDKVLAWTWVISPAPDLIALVPESERDALVRSLTEQIVEAYYEARGLDAPEFAYVLHNRLTKPDSETGERRPQPHTHVVLPGTVEMEDGTRVPFYNRASNGHVKLLKSITDDKFATALDQTIGTAWRELRPETHKVAPSLDIEHSVLPPVPTPADLDDLDYWFPRNTKLEIT